MLFIKPFYKSCIWIRLKTRQGGNDKDLPPCSKSHTGAEHREKFCSLPQYLRCRHMNAIFSRRGNIKQYIINKLKNVVTKASLGHNQ